MCSKYDTTLDVEFNGFGTPVFSLSNGSTFLVAIMFGTLDVRFSAFNDELGDFEPLKADDFKFFAEFDSFLNHDSDGGGRRGATLLIALDSLITFGSKG